MQSTGVTEAAAPTDLLDSRTHAVRYPQDKKWVVRGAAYIGRSEAARCSLGLLYDGALNGSRSCNAVRSWRETSDTFPVIHRHTNDFLNRGVACDHFADPIQPHHSQILLRRS